MEWAVTGGRRTISGGWWTDLPALGPCTTTPPGFPPHPAHCTPPACHTFFGSRRFTCLPPAGHCTATAFTTTCHCLPLLPATTCIQDGSGPPGLLPGTSWGPTLWDLTCPLPSLDTCPQHSHHFSLPPHSNTFSPLHTAHHLCFPLFPPYYLSGPPCTPHCTLPGLPAPHTFAHTPVCLLHCRARAQTSCASSFLRRLCSFRSPHTCLPPSTLYFPNLCTSAPAHIHTPAQHHTTAPAHCTAFHTFLHCYAYTALGCLDCHYRLLHTYYLSLLLFYRSPLPCCPLFSLCLSSCFSALSLFFWVAATTFAHLSFHAPLAHCLALPHCYAPALMLPLPALPALLLPRPALLPGTPLLCLTFLFLALLLSLPRYTFLLCTFLGGLPLHCTFLHCTPHTSAHTFSSHCLLFLPPLHRTRLHTWVPAAHHTTSWFGLAPCTTAYCLHCLSLLPTCLFFCTILCLPAVPLPAAATAPLPPHHHIPAPQTTTTQPHPGEEIRDLGSLGGQVPTTTTPHPLPLHSSPGTHHHHRSGWEGHRKQARLSVEGIGARNNVSK